MAQGMGTVVMAAGVGITRNTLRAIEAGDPAPSIGNYLRVMSVLGVSGELALLAGDSVRPAPLGWKLVCMALNLRRMAVLSAN